MVTRTLRYGLQLPIVLSIDPGPWEDEASAETITAIAREAERLGYAHIAAADHIVIPTSHLHRLGPRWLEPFVALAALAAATSRVQLLTFVIAIPYRSPLAMAKSAATLDFLSGGRFVLGAGTGYMEPEFDALGVPYHQRGAMTNDYLLAMKELWTKDVATYHGRFCAFTDVVLAPKPVQQPHPPIWIGGETPAALRRAAALGDGWLPIRLTPEQLAERVARLHSLPGFAAKAATFEITVPFFLRGVHSPPPGNRSADWSLRDLSTAQVMDLVGRLRDAGATRLHLWLRTETQQEYLERIQWFAQDVMAKA